MFSYERQVESAFPAIDDGHFDDLSLSTERPNVSPFSKELFSELRSACHTCVQNNHEVVHTRHDFIYLGPVSKHF
ncbi:hypothetical protein WT81_30015 [Burkholderia stagnalis]|nr:hypothetical protein WT81_30015 [Burkholderia stagnalis]KWK57762.1 hypothetical protein WT80_29420 [Burkholderia stagnalis]